MKATHWESTPAGVRTVNVQECRDCGESRVATVNVYYLSSRNGRKEAFIEELEKKGIALLPNIDVCECEEEDDEDNTE